VKININIQGWYNEFMNSGASPFSQKTTNSSGASASPDMNAPEGASVERKIIERCQNGDLDAFNQLVHKYERPLFNFSRRLTGNDEDASDIAQEAFVRAYSAIRSFRGEASFTTWLFKITTNIYLDNRKRRNAHPTQSLDEAVEVLEGALDRQIAGNSPDPIDIVERNERTETIYKAIMSLPEYQRVLVILYHQQAQSYEEIAEIMKLPLGTVKSRLNRARFSLKEKLSQILE
jgi:RNA polymerase sigma-70 factor (ECF subfamily)